MKMILKECEDEGGCKGGGFVCEISRLMKNFKDQKWGWSWKALRSRYFKGTRLITLNSTKMTSLKSLRE